MRRSPSNFANGLFATEDKGAFSAGPEALSLTMPSNDGGAVYDWVKFIVETNPTSESNDMSDVSGPFFRVTAPGLRPLAASDRTGGPQPPGVRRGEGVSAGGLRPASAAQQREEARNKRRRRAP